MITKGNQLIDNYLYAVLLSNFCRPIKVEELASRLINSLISVRAKEIALRLQQIRWQVGAAIAVEISQG
jgi:hypothetical protein